MSPSPIICPFSECWCCGQWQEDVKFPSKTKDSSHPTLPCPQSSNLSQDLTGPLVGRGCLHRRMRDRQWLSSPESTGGASDKEDSVCIYIWGGDFSIEAQRHQNNL